MKTIVILFDSLCRRFLPPYREEKDLHTPNFDRLANMSCVYDNAYVSSMPCIPARRDLHTGRLSFLHREWGPLENFDYSVFEELGKQEISTHLITDHYNYWEDSGVNYHSRYSSFEFVRGQEGDRWKGQLPIAELSDMYKPLYSHTSGHISKAMQYNQMNRKYTNSKDPESFPQSEVFNLSCDYIRNNNNQDNWVLQVESMGPHEPFYVPDEYKKLYGIDPVNNYDWTRGQVDGKDTPQQINHIRQLYKAAISFSDYNLGKIFKLIDELNAWNEYTILIGADHGILLSEHHFWSKNLMPLYNEIANVPMFLYSPCLRNPGIRNKQLVQIIDWTATLYDIYNIDLPNEITGRSLLNDTTVNRAERYMYRPELTQQRNCLLFGSFSGHINIYDGRNIYMRASKPNQVQNIFDYTLNPIHMRTKAKKEDIDLAELVEGSWYSNGFKHLRIPSSEIFPVSKFGNLLYDNEEDYVQENAIYNEKLEEKMEQKLIEQMKVNRAPCEQYARIGIHICR